MTEPQTFQEYLASVTAEPFKVEPYYCEDGDLIEIFFRPDPCYGEWVSDHLTLYRSRYTNEVVGFELANIRAIVSEKVTRAEEASTFDPRSGLGDKAKNRPHEKHVPEDRDVTATPAVQR